MEGVQSVVAEASLTANYPSSANRISGMPNSDDLKLEAEDAFTRENSTSVSVHNVSVNVSGKSESKGDPVFTDSNENRGSQTDIPMMPMDSVSYESMNGYDIKISSYQSGGIPENGGTTMDFAGSGVERQTGDVYSHEEERLWTIVGLNCLDFNAWTALIEETEKVDENGIMKIRKVYDAFLGEFPLCFGYWKKYADHELRLDSVEKVVEVYERAVAAVTYSVDIWLHYCTFAISTYEDPGFIRRLFERGLAYVGSDYLSYPLWDEYIRYEESHRAWCQISMIYTRILENPIQQLDRYFNCFKELASSKPLLEIVTSEEAALLASSSKTNVEGLEGNVHSGAVEQSSNLVSAGFKEAELEKYIEIREEMYRKAREYDAKIIDFETAIRRPYFHVKPLDDAELDNWHNYLDFVEKGDDFNKVIKLYERCLIACANYPEYWIRYVSCMENNKSTELTNNALARATQVFVKKQPEIHLFAARIRELSGDIHEARATYQLLYNEVAPCLLEAIVKHANMEYRLGNIEAASSIFEQFIAAEQAKEDSHILSILLVQYSRFLHLVAGDAEKAREILIGHAEQYSLSKALIEAIIHLESILPGPRHVDYLDSLVEKFITPTSDNPNTVNIADREEISSIFLEFLDLFGDTSLIRKAENRHAVLFMRQKSVLVSKKRHSEDYLSTDKAKMAKTYGYGQKATAWPQTSQSLGQQWNPGYASQAGYNAYGTYPNYANPHVSASVPSSAAAYGSYSPYPVQAYPQQSYHPPSPTAAAAASGAFPQPPNAVPQPYYGAYY